MCAVAFFDLNVNIILIGFIVNGLTGDLVAFVMAMYVYTADNTSKGKNRSFLMILANVSMTRKKTSLLRNFCHVFSVDQKWF